MACLHSSARRQLAHQQPPSTHLSLQLLMVPGINPLKGSAQHPHRPAALGQAAPVCGSVDPFCQATHHRPTRLGKGRTDRLSHGQPMQGGPARAHDRNGLATPKQGPQPALTPPIQAQRRPRQGEQLGRKGRISRHQHPLAAAQLLAETGQGIGTPAIAITLQLAAAHRTKTGKGSKGLERSAPGCRPATKVVPNGNQPLGANSWTTRPQQPPKPLLLIPTGAIGAPQQPLNRHTAFSTDVLILMRSPHQGCDRGLQISGQAAHQPALIQPRGALHQHKLNPCLSRQLSACSNKTAAPGQFQTTARQHLAPQLHSIAVKQGLLVVNGQTHHRQLQAPSGKIAVGDTSCSQSLHPRLLKPSRVSAMPHHAGVIRVLGQHTALQ